MDFTLIARAGLRQSEFALLVGVSRTTVNIWVKGKMQPHRYIRAGIETILGCVQAALDKELLPIVGKPTAGRLDELRTIIKQFAPSFEAD